MKYILWPFWVLMVVIYTLCEVVLVVMTNICSVIWHLNINNTIDWVEMTEEETYGFRPAGYDKTIKETIVRRVTFGEYKQYKEE